MIFAYLGLAYCLGGLQIPFGNPTYVQECPKARNPQRPKRSSVHAIRTRQTGPSSSKQRDFCDLPRVLFEGDEFYTA
jgi:hypothetical protein